MGVREGGRGGGESGWSERGRWQGWALWAVREGLAERGDR